jgi:hypothetical protein
VFDHGQARTEWLFEFDFCDVAENRLLVDDDGEPSAAHRARIIKEVQRLIDRNVNRAFLAVAAHYHGRQYQEIVPELDIDPELRELITRERTASGRGNFQHEQAEKA